MSSDAFILQGTIDVDIDKAVKGLKDVDKEVNNSGSALDGFTSKLGGIAKGIVAAFSVKAVVDFTKGCISAAEALEQTNKKTDVIFGDMSQQAKDWALEQERYFGMGSGTIQGYMNSIADITQGMGMAKDKSYEMSQGVVELATQLANWNGIETADAINDIQSALTGTTKGLEKYGIKINDNAKAQAMLNLGLEGTFSELDSATQAQVIYQAALDASGNAIAYWNEGNRSMTFYLNEAKEQWGNITETIGNLFLPIAKKGTEMFADFVANANTFVTSITEGFGKAREEFDATGEYVDALDVFIQEVFGVNMPSTFFYMVESIIAYFQTLWTTVTDIWNNVAVPVFNIIKEMFDSTGITADTVFNYISWIFELAMDVIKTVWESVGQPVMNIIVEILGWVKDKFVEYMPIIQQVFKDCIDIINRVWQDVLKPCFEAIGGFIQNVLAPAFKWAFENVIGPVVDACFRGIGELWNNSLKPIFDGIITFVKGVFTGNWRSAWSGVVQTLGGVWSGITTVIKAPLNAVIGLINKAISAMNKISVTIPDWVPAVGGKTFGVNLPSINYLENGGILTQPTMLNANTMAGEKNKGRQAQAEAVIPLDRLFKEMDRLYGQGKEIVLNIDGRQFMRAVAPYQRELDSYNRRSAKFAY